MAFKFAQTILIIRVGTRREMLYCIISQSSCKKEIFAKKPFV